MTIFSEKNLKAVLLILLLTYAALFFSKQINLINADLGRHIKNGEYAINNFGKKVLSTNFYSYTQPDYPTINHHWGSGVIFYFLNNSIGFTGISIFYSLMSAATVLFIFLTAKKLSNFWYAFFFTTLAIPLLATRTEIRPEGFSYLFTTIYTFVLVYYHKKSQSKIIYLLPALQLFWVNLHIFFAFGLFLIGLFAFQAFIDKNTKKLMVLIAILVLSSIASLINPLGLRGFLVPLTIFREYGYMLAENQPVLFMQKRFPDFKYAYFLLLTFFSAQGLFILLIKKRAKQYLWLITATVIFTIMGIKAVRLFPLFSLAFIPFASFSAFSLLKKMGENLEKALALFTVLLISLSFVLKGQFFSPIDLGTGVGLLPNNLASANFFKEQGLNGPIFNNYDVGGYLIYTLHPDHKVFVDNRPEAYSVDFFKKIYVPMQENEQVWGEMQTKYNFNTIFFYRRDFTPWAQPFLIDRLKDPKWIPVYVDDFTMIMLKDNEQNKKVIEKYKLPEEIFIITKT